MWMTGDAVRAKSAGSAAMIQKCSCSPWRLADIPTTLHAASAAAPSGFTLPSTYAVVTDLDDGVVGVRQLEHRSDDDADQSGRINDLHAAYADIIGELSGPRPPTHVAHVVRCRPGRAVFGIDDNGWGWALSFALNLIDAYWGNVIVVTPHGWTTGRMRAAALTPTTDDLARDDAVVPLRRAIPKRV
jgi:hypothetical protein